MDVCVYCEHELIKVKNGGWQHIHYDGINCLAMVGEFRCGCDTPLLKRDDDQ
jgi:hypothetical protein